MILDIVWSLEFEIWNLGIKKFINSKMQTLIRAIRDAERRKVAVGHFNISDIAAFLAIYKAARELNVPVIIGISEGEREFIGVPEAVALVKSIRDEHKYPMFLNADHTYSLEKIKEAVIGGCDSVIFDGAKLPFEENVLRTKEVVDYVKSINPDILVEGELGYIGQSSKVLDKIPEGAAQGLSLTTAEEAKRFVEATHIDMLAPAVGNIHGMLKDVPEPRLDIERIREIKRAVGIPLVLHGASGNTPEDLIAAIHAGISLIHINTEIRVAWKKGMAAALSDMPDEVAPYKFLAKSEDEVYKVVLENLKFFSGLK